MRNRIVFVLLLSTAFSACRCTPSSVDLGNGTVTTLDASQLTFNSATLNGRISDFNSAPREVGFEWGYSKDKLSYTLQSSDILNGGDGEFSAALEGLNDATVVYYRAYVLFWKDGQGVYRFGDVLSFKTLTQQDKPVPEPEPEPEPGPGPSTYGQPGWYELPVMDITMDGNYMVSASDRDRYFTWHMCGGGEKGPGGKTARNYTLCYSAEHHCPLWVAAPRHSMYVGSSGRTDAYRVDASIPIDIQYNSKSIGGGCNKGHMLGSNERTSSTETNRDVFYYPNIAPQLSSGFNTGGGGWNTLEDWVDGQVCSDTLYVVIGCYFEKFTDGYGNTVNPKTISFGGRSDVGFPTMFYYILMRTKNGKSGKALKDCSASEIKCAAFVRAHTNDLKGQKVSSREMMSVSDLEKITGFTYFPNVPNAPKGSFSASDWGL